MAGQRVAAAVQSGVRLTRQMTIDLANLSAISERLNSLHDCPFDLDQAQLNCETREWLGVFLRPVWDAPEAQHRRRAFLILESQLPVVEARLRLRMVNAVRLVDDQRIGQYSFNRVERINEKRKCTGSLFSGVKVVPAVAQGRVSVRIGKGSRNH